MACRHLGHWAKFAEWNPTPDVPSNPPKSADRRAGRGRRGGPGGAGGRGGRAGRGGWGVAGGAWRAGPQVYCEVAQLPIRESAFYLRQILGPTGITSSVPSLAQLPFRGMPEGFLERNAVS